MAEPISRGRNWCFTLNADEDTMEDFTWSDVGAACPVAGWMDDGKIQYMVCQVEKGEQGHVRFPWLSLAWPNSQGPATRLSSFMQ